MHNTVIIDNPKRGKLKLAAFSLGILMIFFLVMAVVMILMLNNDYNGETETVEGVVTAVSSGDSHTLTIGEETFNTTLLANIHNADCEQLLHKTVTLQLPAKQLFGTYRTVLGVTSGETVIDAAATIELQRHDCKVGAIVLGSVAAALLIACTAVVIWRLNVAAQIECDLTQQYSLFTLGRHPICKQRKWIAVYFAVMIALTVAFGIASQFTSGGVGLAMSLATLCMVPLMVAGYFPLVAVVRKRERAFYAENFPFDFFDASQIAMRKKFREELQQMIDLEKQLHPHRYGDGGNGYNVDFTPDGVVLSQPDAGDLPPVNDVFDAELPPEGKLVPYAKLHFEAVPFYRKKDHPLNVMIRSRIDPSDLSDLPQDMENDLNIVLDSNLLTTLRQFDVQVDNLQYLLDNKRQLMAENCTMRRKRK